MQTFVITSGGLEEVSIPTHWKSPCRVWFTVRTTGTHLNDFKIFNKYTYKATGKEVYGAPEALSLTFNAEGKATSVTGGTLLSLKYKCNQYSLCATL